MPIVRPFRALRYDPARVGDLAAVISPPYDVISPEQQRRLLERHPRNSVRLDLPEERPGDEPDARYRQAAADLVAWRSDGTLRKDPVVSLYVYESEWRPSGGGPDVATRTQRGVFVRLKLEPFGPQAGILPHERTLGGPKEDRYRLLRATGANLSPIVGLYRTSGGETAALLDELTCGDPTADALDDDGVRHRLWAVPVDDPGRSEAAHRLTELAGAGPITIADGHHRYETALRWRDERAALRVCPHDPPYEFILALLYDTAATDLLVLPTHRLVQGEPAGEALLAAARKLFRVEELASGAALLAAFGPSRESRALGLSEQRIGLYTRGQAAMLRPDRAALAPLLDATASETLRWLDVSVLGAALERLLGIDRSATAGGRLGYTKDAAEAIATVDAGSADSAFLLDPLPVEVVSRIAGGGELMPQKSTYFFPKPATGLLFSPGEW